MADRADTSRDDHYAWLNTQPIFRLRHPLNLPAAWWALRAVRSVRKQLKVAGLRADVPAPPRLPWGARAGVNIVLRRLAPTCLERAVVLQRWLLSHGILFDVVVGVRRGEHGEVFAHAWIEEVDDPDTYATYQTIHRLPPAA